MIHHFIAGGVLAAIAAWPIWLKACATVMVGEIAYYWAHRLSHRFRSSGGFMPSITVRS